MSTNSTGAAASRAYQQGARFANGEFVQFHPTAMIGDDKLRLMSEASRGEGGRIWAPRRPGDTREPAVDPRGRALLLPRGVVPDLRQHGARATWPRAPSGGWCSTWAWACGGEDRVYLDLTHQPRDVPAHARLGGILEMYETFTGEDPYEAPMKVFPAVALHHGRPVGGLREGREDAGGMKRRQPAEPPDQHPRPLRLRRVRRRLPRRQPPRGQLALLSASFSGRVAGEAAAAYVKGLARQRRADPADAASTPERRRQEEINQGILGLHGRGEPLRPAPGTGRAHDRQGVRGARQPLASTRPWPAWPSSRSASRTLGLDDQGPWANASLSYARQVQDMIVLAEVIAAGARLRDECRGSHYKPEFEMEIPEGKFPGDPEYEDYVARWKAEQRPVAEEHGGPAHARRAVHRLPPGGHLGAAARDAAGLPVGPPCQDTIHFKIKRQDRPQAAPYWQEFAHPLPAGAQRGLGADGHPGEPGHRATASGWPRWCGSPTAWRRSAGPARCASTAGPAGLLGPGGHARPAHRARAADQVPGGARPAGGPRASCSTHLRRVKAWVEIDGSWDIHTGAPRISPAGVGPQLRSAPLHDLRLLHGRLPPVRPGLAPSSAPPRSPRCC